MEIIRYQLTCESRVKHTYILQSVNASIPSNMPGTSEIDNLDKAIELASTFSTIAEIRIMRMVKGTSVTAGLAARIFPQPCHNCFYPHHQDIHNLELAYSGPFELQRALDIIPYLVECGLRVFVVRFGWGYNVGVIDKHINVQSMLIELWGQSINSKSTPQTGADIINGILKGATRKSAFLGTLLRNDIDALNEDAFGNFFAQMEVCERVLGQTGVVHIESRSVYTQNTDQLDSLQECSEVDDFGFAKVQTPILMAQ